MEGIITYFIYLSKETKDYADANYALYLLRWFLKEVLTMSHSRYLYVLSREDMERSTKPSVVKKGLDCTRDLVEPIESLLSDAARSVHINGKNITTNKAVTNGNVNQFTKLIQSKIKPKHFENLNKHYSQGPLLMAGQMLFPDDAKEASHLFTKPTMHIDLFEKGGELYVKVKASNYHILAKPDLDEVGTIKGPVEVLYKLTDDNFEFQSISTNSKLLHDMYLGKKPEGLEIENEISIEKNKALQDLQKMEYALEKHQQKLLEAIPGGREEGLNVEYTTAMTSDRVIKKMESTRLEYASVKNSLKVIDQYKKGKIDLENLRTAIKEYNDQIPSVPSDSKLSRFYTRMIKPSTAKVLNNALTTLKSLEAQQKKQMKNSR